MWGSPQSISILCAKTSFVYEQLSRPLWCFVFWRASVASLVLSAPSPGTARQVRMSAGGGAPAAASANERACCSFFGSWDCRVGEKPICQKQAAARSCCSHMRVDLAPGWYLQGGERGYAAPQMH